MKSKMLKSAAAGALCLSMAALPLQNAKADVGLAAVVGVAAVTGVVAFVIGNQLGSRQAVPAYVPLKYNDGGGAGGIKKCAMTYKSFNPNTGMITVNGKQRVCPFIQ